MKNYTIQLFFFTAIALLSCYKTPSKSKTIVERSYFNNGNLEYEATYLNGKLDGISRVWYEDGALLSESNYNNGIPHGEWKIYYKNQSIKYEGTYEYGAKFGYEKWFYENGQLKSKQKFIMGKPLAEITRWKPDGTLIY